MNKILIKGGTIINEGKSFISDIYINNYFIEKIGESLNLDTKADQIIDASGCLVLPGIIDDQVHFRQPGLESKGTIASESKAALAGGITSFMEMPNTKPPTITSKLIQSKKSIAERESWCNYSFYIGATNDNIEEIRSIDRGAVCGIKVFMGSSTGNLLVDNYASLIDIFKDAEIPIAVHSEDEETINRNTSACMQQYGEKPDPSIHQYIRNSEACIICTQRAIGLSEENGGHLHLLHVSTAEEVNLIRRAKKKGVNITAEVCVHHLFFSSIDYKIKGNLIKWNPSIKSKRDKLALIEGLKEGVIDIVATDHAPHELQSKLLDYFNAPSGGPMVQHSLQVMLRLAEEGKFSYEQVVSWMAHKPADIFKVDRRGYIREGFYGDIVIVKENEKHRIKAQDSLYKVKWSPIENEFLYHKILYTVVNGKIVYDNGVFYKNNRFPMALKFNR